MCLQISSLGTGEVPIFSYSEKSGFLAGVPATLDGPMLNSSRGTDMTLKSLFKKVPHHYTRIQPILSRNIDLADTSPESIKTLKKMARKQEKTIQNIARKLLENYDNRRDASGA